MLQATLSRHNESVCKACHTYLRSPDTEIGGKWLTWDSDRDVLKINFMLIVQSNVVS